MTDYTPTTEEIRASVIVSPWDDSDRKGEEFDRWLEEHDAELLERAARIADYEGHIWSGAPSRSFFQVADKIRELKETT